MLTIALVSYINTRPFTDGLEHLLTREEFSLHLLPPAECATYLREKKADMALIPIGSLHDFQGLTLLPHHCIGADGAVDSVFIFSQQPIEEIDTLILDRHSRTSNVLAKILLKKFWKKEVRYQTSIDKNFEAIQEKTAGVVIGDKALKIKSEYTYSYDLAEYWKHLTGLPFVFAVWAFYADKVSASQQKLIETALEWGVAQRDASAIKWATHYNLSQEVARNYVNQSIQYHFTDLRQEAMELYLKWKLEIERG